MVAPELLSDLSGSRFRSLARILSRQVGSVQQLLAHFVGTLREVLWVPQNFSEFFQNLLRLAAVSNLVVDEVAHVVDNEGH